VQYDLLIKGGRVFDPGQGLDGRLDVGISQGRIVAIQPDIPAGEAKRSVEVRGDNRYVVPGLIDVHAHVAFGAQTPGVNWQAADPELAGGGALLAGLDRRVAEATQMPVHVADDPLTCVVRGTGRALEEIDVLRKVFIAAQNGKTAPRR